MSHLTKKLFVIALTVTTIAWAMGGFVVPVQAVSAGSLIKTATSAAVYYVGTDNKKYVFPDSEIYFSWYTNFSGVQVVSQDTLQGIQTTANVKTRAGTKLVQFVAINGNGTFNIDDPKVYAVTPDGMKHWLTTEAVASGLYGSTWATKIHAIPNTLTGDYPMGADITSATYPQGSIVKTASSATVYYINATGQKQPFSGTGFSANMFQDRFINTASDLASYPDGTSITALDATLTTVAGNTVTPSTPSGSGLTVAVASDNPASTTIIADTTGSQGLIPTLKLNFTASSDGAVIVKNLNLKRLGINATTDFDNVYLYDVDGNYLASQTSIGSTYITFSNAAGLFTVTAGTTKPIFVKFNMNSSASAGKTIGLKVDAASDITTDGATVNGTFPLQGNQMTVAVVTDYGKFSRGGTDTYPSTVDPSTSVQDLWSFNYSGSDQDVTLEKIVFSQVGSVNSTDITDLQLYVSGSQIGTTQANLGSTNKVTFSNLNYVIPKTSKTFTLKGKVIGGSSRTFRFSIQNVYDLMVKDNNYGGYVVPNSGTDNTWTVHQAGAATTVNYGSLSIVTSSSSPTGNIAAGTTDTSVAKFDFLAVGEDVKVTTLYVGTGTASTDAGLYQTKLFVDGSQIGTTKNVTSTTYWDLGSSFVVPAGTTKTLEVKGTIKKDYSGAFAVGDTVQIKLNSGGSGAAQGVSSLTQLTLSSAVPANLLTVATSAPTISVNTNINNFTTDNPTGVKNQQNVLVASFTVIGSPSEPIDITTIQLADYNATGDEMGDYFRNLEIYKNSFVPANKIGNTIANLTYGTAAADTYTFTPATAIRVGINETITLDVYASVLPITTALTTPGALAVLNQVTYNQVNSGNSTTWSTTANGQANVLLLSGTLTVSAPDTQVASNLVTMSGSSANVIELAKFKFVGKYESMNIEKIVFNNTIAKTNVVSTTNATSSLVNYTLWDGTTQVGGYGVDAATATPVEGKYIVFNMSSAYVLTAGTHEFTLKAQVNTLFQSAAGSTDTITLRTTWSGQAAEYGVQTVRGASSQTLVTSVPSATITGPVLYVNRAVPIVTKQTLSSNTLVNGTTQTLYKWNVAPSGDGSIKIKKMTFNVSITDTTTSSVLTFDDFVLKKNGSALTYGTDYFIYDGVSTAAAHRLDQGGTGSIFGNYFSDPTHQSSSATGTVVIVFATEDTVGASGNIYELQARSANVSTLSTDNDNITLTLMGADDAAIGDKGTPASAGVTGAFFLMGDPAANFYGNTKGMVVNLNTAVDGSGTEYEGYFLWSDYSKDSAHASITNAAAKASGSSTQDWFSGYKVRTSTGTANTYLPLDSETVSK